jgi:hypothetical protein
MHTKINTNQNDPNFLTHVIWSETSLGLAVYTPRTIMNLSKKIKNISRINISDNHKIVINSPEVYFGITK